MVDAAHAQVVLEAEAEAGLVGAGEGVGLDSAIEEGGGLDAEEGVGGDFLKERPPGGMGIVEVHGAASGAGAAAVFEGRLG